MQRGGGGGVFNSLWSVRAITTRSSNYLAKKLAEASSKVERGRSQIDNVHVHALVRDAVVPLYTNQPRRGWLVFLQASIFVIPQQFSRLILC